MKRLDLIISAIEDALKDFATDSYDNDYHGCCGADLDVGHTADCKLAQALTYARKLRKMEPVAVWELMEDGWDTIADSNWMETLPVGTKLYALGDEK